mmetsp:Transcript_20159/g.47189  ORF Transcript_20159/g.47189 Transcript_20159/m.47189 type:complete len:129 (+) Transcript_20159:689-1075(+)
MAVLKDTMPNLESVLWIEATVRTYQQGPATSSASMKMTRNIHQRHTALGTTKQNRCGRGNIPFIIASPSIPHAKVLRDDTNPYIFMILIPKDFCFLVSKVNAQQRGICSLTWVLFQYYDSQVRSHVDH